MTTMTAQFLNNNPIPSGLNVRILFMMSFVSGVVNGSQVVVPPKVNAVLGKNVTLGCTVQLDTNLSLTQSSWDRKLPTGWVTLAVYNPTFGISIPPEYERRLSFRSPSPRDATIVLEDVGFADVGIYTCKVTTFPLGNMQAFTTVSVLGVVNGSQVVVPPKVNAVLGENVTLGCTVQLDTNLSLTQSSWERKLPTGWVTLAVYNPTFGISIPPKYERRLSFRSPSPRDATIVLEDVGFADVGIYTCKVTTFPLGNMQAFTTVGVLGVVYGSQVVIPPKLKALLKSKNFTLGGTVQLDTNLSLTISSGETSGEKFIESVVFGSQEVIPPKVNAVMGENVTLGGTVQLDTNLSLTISSGKTIIIIESVVNGSQVVVPPKVNAVLGKNVTLGCTVQLDTNLSLTQSSWERKLPTGWVTLAVYNPTLGISIPPEYERRLSFRSPSPRDATIVLEDVGFADVGIYTCKVTTFPLGNMQAFTTVSVLVEPKVYISAGSSALIDGGNKTTVATCIAERGRPPSEVSWATDLYGTSDAHMQDDANGTTTTRVHYTWHPTRHAQGHTLTCVVKHPALHKDFWIPYTINVQFAPDIQVLGYDCDWYVGRKNVRLQCQAKANPPAHHFRWIRLNGEMPDGAQVLNNSLVFTKPLHKNDSGVYKCDVANDIGLQSRDIRIRIQDPPSTTTTTTMPPTTPVRLLTADISATGPGHKRRALINSTTLAPLPEGSLGAIVGAAVGGALILLLLLILARIYYQSQRQTFRVY